MPGEVIFTSGGTESNNLAIKGALLAAGGRLITSKAEHEAVLTQAENLKARGLSVDLVPPEPTGSFDLASLASHLGDDTRVVSLMHANNEVGVVNPVASIGRFCRDREVYFHCDAVQSAGLFEIRPGESDIDLMSVSAHKFYGPKGVGWLYARSGVELAGVIEGGAQERRRRGGTENVPGIVGMAAAFDLAVEERQSRRAHLVSLRRRLLDGLGSHFESGTFVLNSPEDDANAAPHIVNMAFPPIDGEALDGEMLILNMDMEGVCVSSGSACTSGAIEPSHVLLAMGLDRATASASVRFSVGKDTTPEEIDRALERLQTIVARMRKKTVAS
jgi:cysteine desulfurase